MAVKDIHIGGKPGMSVDHGTVVGRQGAGLNAHTGGDPMMHSFNHYGKGASMGGLMDAMGMGGDISAPSGPRRYGLTSRSRVLKGL
jgi:hypothetical protein